MPRGYAFMRCSAPILAPVARSTPLMGSNGARAPARAVPENRHPRRRREVAAMRTTRRDLELGQGRTDDLPDRRRPASGRPRADRRTSFRPGRARLARLRRGASPENEGEAASRTPGPARSAADGPALAGTTDGSLPFRSRLSSTSLRPRRRRATPLAGCRTQRAGRDRGIPRRLRSAGRCRSLSST